LVMKVILTIAVMLIAPVSAQSLTGADTTRVCETGNCSIHAQVISCAGAPTVSVGYLVTSTFGQCTPIGVGVSGDTILDAGYWRTLWRITSVPRRSLVKEPRNSLSQNHPNPFNPSTTICFTVAKTSKVELRVFNLRGQVVRSLVSRMVPQGKHRVVWDGRNEEGKPVSSGVYFYHLRAGSYSSARKMLLLK